MDNRQNPKLRSKESGEGGGGWRKLMAGFTKLHASILDSSIWGEPHHVRIVWITMLAMADAEGVVAASVTGIARRAVVTLDEAEDAIRVLSGPDQYSRDGTTGERIEAVPGGWMILNHRQYRDKQTDTQAATAARVRRHRERMKQNERASVTGNDVTPRNDFPLSEAEAEAEAEEEKTPPTPPRGEADPPKAADSAARPRRSAFDPLTVSIPASLDTPAFREAWRLWCERCAELGAKHRQTRTIAASQIRKLEKLGHDRAIAALDHSTATHWQGIFEPDASGATRNGHTGQAGGTGGDARRADKAQRMYAASDDLPIMRIGDRADRAKPPVAKPPMEP